jgi:hypothetical protein
MTILVIILLLLYIVISLQEDMDDKDQKLNHHQFNHYHQFNTTVLSELENLGELYYDKDQKYSERHGILALSLSLIPLTAII